MGVCNQQDDEDTVYHGEVAHHAQNRFLLGTFDVGRADQFRGASKLCARPGCRDLRDCFAAPHQCSRVCFKTGASFDRNGFACEHGLVKQHRSLDQAHVGGNHGAERQLHNISDYQFGGGNGLPGVIALDCGI